MLAFRIEVDDRPPLVAGVEDWAILSLHVNAVCASAYKRDADDLDISAGGMTKDDARRNRIPLPLAARFPQDRFNRPCHFDRS